MPEVHLGEVHGEDFIFGIGTFDLHCGDRFTYLSFQGLPPVQVQISCELLGYGGCALLGGHAGDVDQRGAQNAKWINSPVFVESLVFSCEYSRHQVFG
ncbi:hypothetical protein BMS3Bbin04_01689 [bacterium BMS3Bbin04]|nr:hypothetical protein BMS3Bbin04_01689 [bacterium BMS3Bbin04]